MVATKLRSKASDQRSRGRPRDPAVEQRLLVVTLQHLASEGYSRMSVDAIAEQAGVSKPTIYRRWKSKADIATAALRLLQIAEPNVDTGSTVGDITGILIHFRRSLLRPNGLSLIGTVLAEEHHTPELLELFRQRIVAPRREMIRLVLERARIKRELRPRADIETAVNMLIGAFYAHYLASPRIAADYPAQLVAMVWTGISRV